MTRRIAIIPARGGSKRIPQKNIIDFCGKPLIAHSISAAVTSRLFDKIHVSTDDEQIAEIASKHGADIDFMRPPELADDYTPLIPVIRWVLQEYLRQGNAFNEVCLLMPCAPLIESGDLVAAQKIFSASSRELPVIAVAEYPVPVEWAFGIGADGALDPREPGMFAVRSQDLDKKYYDAGSFSYFPIDLLLQETFTGDGKMLPYALPRHRAIDIDEPDDVTLAKIIFNGLRQTDD